MTSYLNVNDVAERIRKSPRWVRAALADKAREPAARRYVHSDELLALVPPMRKLGREYRILASDFEAHIAQFESRR